jgi:N6-adenosine-specific RNA methylase IME4
LPEEFKQLEINILEDGKCTEPLTVWGNILVDGHNRYKICRSHPHIKFKTDKVEFESRDHAMLWIDEHQAGRRNINDDQRSILGKRIVARRSKIAMQKQRAAASKAAAAARTARATGEENVSASVKSQLREKTRAAVAKELNLSEWKLRGAIEIDTKTKKGAKTDCEAEVARKDAKTLDRLVLNRKITINEGKKLAALPPDTRRQAIKSVEKGADVRTAVRAARKEGYNARIEASRPKPLKGKYRIIYADPPWKYHGLNQADEYGHAERHYNCLDDDQLSAFRPDGVRQVKELADENAVLFIWVTSPVLERCFAIIRAWGFRYKASFVWDKIKHVMGHYNSVRHEFLLICTRGSCKPDVPKLIDSVQSIKRSDKHSEKPHQFYEIIESLYDHGRKLELFSRTRRQGWDAVSNEGISSVFRVGES